MVYKNLGHFHSPKSMTSAAITIQRAWRNCEGLISLGNQLDCECFENLRDDKPALVHFGSFATPEKISVFQRWMKKLLVRTKVLDAEILALDNNLIMCFFIDANEDRFHGADALILAADLLVTDVLDMALGYFDVIRELEKRIRAFLVEYATWSEVSSVGFLSQLRNDVIVTVYYAARPATIDDDIRSQEKLRRLMVMYTVMYRDASKFRSSPVYLAIILARRSTFCKSVVSQAKMLHQMVIEDNVDFNIPLEKSIPELVSKHSSGGKIIDSQALRDDVMCVLVCAVDDGDILEIIADTCHEARHFPGDVFAERVMVIVLHIMSNSPRLEQVNLEWDAKKSTRPLDALVYSVRVLRNVIENEVVDVVSQTLPQYFDNDNKIPNVLALSVLKITDTTLTSLWIASCLCARSKKEIGALAAGNPFVLLEFFNTSVLKLVIDNTTPDLLDLERLPEFLLHDRERLVVVRLELSFGVFTPRVLMEYINADRWMGKYKPGPSFLDAVEKFRKILVFCRWVHGDFVCKLIVGMANAMTDSSKSDGA